MMKQAVVTRKLSKMVFGLLFFCVVYVAGAGAIHAQAETLGDFTYEVNQQTGEATITKFSESSTKTDVEIPDKLDGHLVTKIERNAFMDNESVARIVIPASVTNIDIIAFSSCPNLQEIDVNEKNKVYCSYNGAVYNADRTALIVYPCGSDSVSMPKSVTSIADHAFSGCSKLKDVVIPESVTSIEGYAFYYCVNLKTITVSSKMKDIDSNIDRICYNLTDINVDSDNPYYTSQGGVLFSKDKTKLIRCPGGKKAYSIPAGTKIIGCGSFYSCDKLSEVEIPSTVTYIETYAFASCRNLTKLAIPASVTEIENKAFFWAGGIKEIIVDKNNPVYSSEDNALFNKNKTTLIYCAMKNRKSYKVPSSVTLILRNALDDCREIDSITILSNVKTIEEDGIYNAPHAIIYTTKNSAADKYAATNRITVKYIEETKPSKPAATTAAPATTTEAPVVKPAKKVTMPRVIGLKLTKGKKSVKVQFKAIRGARYKIAYSTSKSALSKVKNGSFKKVKKVTYRFSKTNKITIKKLKSKKKYYVKVCAYKVVKGKYVIGNWSSVKSVKTK